MLYKYYINLYSIYIDLNMNKIIELSEIIDNYITDYSNSLSTKTRNKKPILGTV